MQTEKNVLSNPWSKLIHNLQEQVIGDFPRITVVIPTYNSAYSINRTLDSILQQEYPNLEIIIIDAGSQDKTLKLIRGYKEHIAQIYFMTDFNYTLMCNKGFNLATGDYITFMWSGRTYLTGFALKHIGSMIQKTNHPDFIYSGSYVNFAYETDPFIYSLPLTVKELKAGNIPPVFSCWFKVSSVIKLGILKPNYSFRKAWFDLLCRLRKNDQMEIASTKWILLEFNYRDISTKLVLKDYWDRSLMICKHFGPLAVILWFMKKKPFPFLPWIYRKLRRRIIGR